MPLLTNFSYIVAVSFIGVRYLPQVTDQLYHVKLYQVFDLTTLVVIGTDCTGSCKSNYHTITTINGPT